MILSEAHFVGEKNEVRPLGIYDPNKDVTPNVGSVTYRVEPIAADQLSSVGKLVYERNF